MECTTSRSRRRSGPPCGTHSARASTSYLQLGKAECCIGLRRRVNEKPVRKLYSYQYRHRHRRTAEIRARNRKSSEMAWKSSPIKHASKAFRSSAQMLIFAGLYHPPRPQDTRVLRVDEDVRTQTWPLATSRRRAPCRVGARLGEVNSMTKVDVYMGTAAVRKRRQPRR